MPDVQVILGHLQAGLKVREIAQLTGASEGAIYSKIKRHGIDPSAFRVWKERKADALAFLQAKTFEAALERIPKTGFRDLMTGFNIAHNAERLERGLSTQNVGIEALMASISALDEQEKKLREQLGLKDETPSNEPGADSQ